MHPFARSTLLALPFLLLSACTTVAPPAPPSPQVTWKDRELALSRIHNWQVNGKIAVQTANDAGSANVDWIQNNNQYRVALYGPLGAGSVKLAGQPGHVTLETANGKRASANSPEQLLAKQLGWNLPVSNLTYWIRGLPVPGAPSNNQFDNSHRLAALDQQGWKVQFLSYTRVDNVDLPSKITVSGAGLKSKMVIHQWKLR